MLTAVDKTLRNTAPYRREHIRCRPLDDQAILYDLAHNTLHYLNGTAFFIWNCCDGFRSPQDIAAEILSAFDVDGNDPQRLAMVLNDVRNTLAELFDEGLIDFNGRDYDHATYDSNNA